MSAIDNLKACLHSSLSCFEVKPPHQEYDDPVPMHPSSIGPLHTQIISLPFDTYYTHIPYPIQSTTVSPPAVPPYYNRRSYHKKYKAPPPIVFLQISNPFSRGARESQDTVSVLPICLNKDNGLEKYEPS